MVDLVNKQRAADIQSMLSGPAGWFRFTNAPAEGRESGPVFIHASTLIAFAPLGMFMEVRTANASWLVRENYLALTEILDMCRFAVTVDTIEQIAELTEKQFPDVDFHELAKQLLAIKERLL